ncbi:hypothetical protein [Clostridium magnum]|uniref:Uncharacterized protein n=1 Tax=Clostridium magnum DSM 2767 TaxID=1121326 RepID=A0A161X8D5_9CLOT|nr:hypothetical protein [Clostridium magnum]KZL90426.1 hypothetical protein CLMAG_41970 [Clostridium magnum DSM 2767]SHH84853.1 hypothetical protein SAMN02745944_01574 [Clostridium magnum DSM 2767]
MNEKKLTLIEKAFNFLFIPFLIFAALFGGGPLETSQLLLLGWNKYNELAPEEHL